MDGVDLVSEIFDALENVRTCVENMPELGEKKAEALRKFRVQVQVKTSYERSQKHTPVSIISDLVLGYPEIAELEKKSELARVDYDANHEASLYWKKRVDVLREMIAREWSRAGEEA